MEDGVPCSSLPLPRHGPGVATASLWHGREVSGVGEEKAWVYSHSQPQLLTPQAGWAAGSGGEKQEERQDEPP